MGDFFTILITGGIIVSIIVVAINFIVKTIIVNNRSVLNGGLALLIGALTASKFTIIWVYIAAVIGIIPFLNFLSYIALFIAFYHFIHAFPLAFGWVFAFIAGIVGDEILNNLPVFMLNYYNRNTIINFYPVITYKNGESDEKPDVFLTKGAWEDIEFFKEVEKYLQGKRASIPYRNEYDLMASVENYDYDQKEHKNQNIDINDTTDTTQEDWEHQQTSNSEYDYSKLEVEEIRAVEAGYKLGTIQAVLFCFNDEETMKVAKLTIEKYREKIVNNISLNENELNDLLEIKEHLSNLIDDYLRFHEEYVKMLGEADFKLFREQINVFYTGFNLIYNGSQSSNKKISSTGFEFLDDYESQCNKILS